MWKTNLLNYAERVSLSLSPTEVAIVEVLVSASFGPVSLSQCCDSTYWAQHLWPQLHGTLTHVAGSSVLCLEGSRWCAGTAAIATLEHQNVF